MESSINIIIACKQKLESFTYQASISLLWHGLITYYRPVYHDAKWIRID